MYALLTGAKRNLGDFLIGDRATALLRHFLPNAELLHVQSWKPLGDEVNGVRALIILGGPGYQPRFYPGVYPLRTPLDSLPCPVVPMGLGWKGIPGDSQTEQTYAFSERSLEALRWIAARTPWLGCRDLPSANVLARHGFTNTLMTGCPVWYHLPSLGQAMHLPRRVERLVFTPPQVLGYIDQAIRVAEVLAGVFPTAERICAFHRGLSDWIGEEDRTENRRVADAAAALGFEVRDVAGSVENSRFYGSMDLHVGYRVHAHLQFVSERRPSVLLHEDGRGIGASGALELRGLDAFRRTRVGVATGLLPAHGPRLQKYLHKYLPPTHEPDPQLPEKLKAMLRVDLDTGFARYAGVARRIDAHLPVMERFIRALP
jgi:Polysaccharide pyruvyl transferase